jgi:hypothetical protein
MMILQVAHQQGCGPDRRARAEVTRVRVNDLSALGVAAAARRVGPAGTRGVGQPPPQAERGAVVKPLPPVILVFYSNTVTSFVARTYVNFLD